MRSPFFVLIVMDVAIRVLMMSLGPFLKQRSYFAEYAVAECQSSSGTHKIDASGVAEFEFDMRGRVGQLCKLIVQVTGSDEDSFFTLRPFSCAVELTGCEDGYEVKEDSNRYDYCEKGAGEAVAWALQSVACRLNQLCT